MSTLEDLAPKGQMDGQTEKHWHCDFLSLIQKWQEMSLKPVDVGQETEYCLDVLHLPKHLGSNDGVGLEHLDNARVNLLWLTSLM